MIIKDKTGTMTMTGDVINLNDDETIRMIIETVVRIGMTEEIRLLVIETIEEIRPPVTEMIEETKLLETEITETIIKGEREMQTTIKTTE